MGKRVAKIENALEDIRAGKIVIVVDDEDRENEGDFIMAAEKATAQAINFMARYGARVDLLARNARPPQRSRLGYDGQYQHRATRHPVHREHRRALRREHGHFGTGSRGNHSAICRSSIAARKFWSPRSHLSIARHARWGLRRAGHTEAAVDLARLAGLSPVGVLCEILNEDGTMARLPQLLEFAAQFDLNVVTIHDLIAYRRRSEKLVRCVEQVDLPTRFGAFQLHLYESDVDDREHVALVKGDLSNGTPVLVRMHSECLTGDALGSLRCDCEKNLHSALEMIEDAGRGALVYMRQEGRGIGLRAKLHAYKLQEDGYDTVEANLKLGFKMDERDYGIGAQILSDLGIRKVKLITNNPSKRVGLEAYGIEIVDRVPVAIQVNKWNLTYMRTKREKMGHLFREGDLQVREEGDRDAQNL